MSQLLLQFVAYSDEKGAYVLQKAGYFALAVVCLLLVIVAAAIVSRKDRNNDLRSVRLAVSAISLTLACVTSYLKLFELPWGGSVTLFSMFFVCFVGYLYGPATGLTAAFAYSILQFLLSGGTYILTIPQVLLDYIFAFTALGIAGFFYRRKHGLIVGYIAACVARGVFATLAGYMFWMDCMPDGFPKSLSFIYPIAYNFCYIGIEMALTLVVLAIPDVRKAIKNIAYEATQNRRGAVPAATGLKSED
ncbi:MAG: energy-coupled thiamine transporter ThiT [Lachnospiraceae bacterium]|nr:energy-coupled thiamine transporter ThiT [Lachnospiraceae bacterium]